jgi:DNA-binding response OmpR family regulator
VELHPLSQFARIIVLDEHVQPRECILDADRYDIGRSPLCQIVIDRAIISRNHARLERDGARYILCDLNSHNGTFVNGRRLNREERYVLSDHDRIGLGTAEAVLQFIDPNPTADVPGRLYYDRQLNTFVLNRQPLELTPTEFCLLEYLYQHAGQLCAHEDCVRATWKHDYDPDRDADKLHRAIADLRQKLRRFDPSITIDARRGRGYILTL